MPIGIDFSGKIEQFPLILVAIKTDDYSCLDLLIKHLADKGIGIKRIKARKLKERELHFFCKNVKFPVFYIKLTSYEYSHKYYRKYREERHFKPHFISSLVFRCYRPLFDHKTSIFVHKEYMKPFPEIVERDLNSLNIKFLKGKVPIKVSSNDLKIFRLADLLAGAIRKGIKIGKEVKPEVENELKFLLKKK